MSALEHWLARVPFERGFRAFCPAQPFEGFSEEEYERRIGSRSRLNAGAAVYRLYQHFGGDPDGTALEIGAGAGAATVGFVDSAARMRAIITDPSPAFLRLTREKLRRENLLSERLELGTLDGEALHLLPSETLDLVFVQAAIHHVLDYCAFFQDAARALKPGGMLIFQEPFSEGYLLMTVAVECMLNLTTPTPSDREKLLAMKHAMLTQSNRQLAKDSFEDKHCFFTDEILTLSWQTFDRVFFLRNQSFDSLFDLPSVEEALTAQACRFSITAYLRSFMEHHHGLSTEALHSFDVKVAPLLAPVDALCQQGDGPAALATVVCIKDR